MPNSDLEKVGIFFIVEPGKLEYQAEILVKTLRKFGEFPIEYPIFAFQPRKSGKLSKRTFLLFQEWNVTFEKVNLNKKYFFYPLANKVLTAAYFEKKYGGKFDLLAFFDTDILIVSSIAELFSIRTKIGIAPVHTSSFLALNVGTKKPPLLWQIIMEQMQLSIDQFWTTKSLSDNKEILHYYNSGLVLMPSNLSHFQLNCSYFNKVMCDSRILNLDYTSFYFIEQACLSASLILKNTREFFRELNIYHNYPIEETQKDLEKATVVHYQHHFNNQHNIELLPFDEKIKESIRTLHNFKSLRKWWVRPKEILVFQFFKLKLKFKYTIKK